MQARRGDLGDLAEAKGRFTTTEIELEYTDMLEIWDEGEMRLRTSSHRFGRRLQRLPVHQEIRHDDLTAARVRFSEGLPWIGSLDLDTTTSPP